MRRLVGLLVVAGYASICHLPLAADEKDAPPSYFPLAVGAKWSYKLDLDGNVNALEYKVAKIEKIDGQDVAEMEVSADGRVVSTEQLATNDQGVFRHRYNDAKIDPPSCLLKYPVKAGDTWDLKTKVGDTDAKMTCRVADEMPEIEVPAGKYTTVVVDIETDLDGQTIKAKFWFSEGVGFVKQEFEFRGFKGSLELEKFEPAKAESK